MRLLKCPLQAQAVASSEGFQRAMAMVPLGSKALYLGAEPPTEQISLYVLAPPRAAGADGQEVPYAATELAPIEFILAFQGNPIPNDCQFRAAIRMPDGILFLFERLPASRAILLPPGARGN